MNTWTWSWAIRNFVAELLMPPSIWIFVALLAIFLLNRKKVLQKGVVMTCLLLIWITSTTAFANWFVQVTDHLMQWPKPVDISKITSQNLTKAQQIGLPQAIVILGGGKRHGALELPEYSYSDVSKETMERLRVGAKLAKQTGLPVLLTGGSPDATSNEDLSEAAVMAMVMKSELGTKATWLEEKSNTTQENAQLTAEILKKEGINKVYLVTHFWHMPRSQRIFEKEGIQTTPIAHAYQDKNQFEIDQLTPVDFFPSTSGVSRARQIWHELTGLVWYAIKG